MNSKFLSILIVSLMLFLSLGAISATSHTGVNNHQLSSDPVPMFVNPTNGHIHDGDYFTVTFGVNNGSSFHPICNQEVDINMLHRLYIVHTDENGVAKVKMDVGMEDMTKNFTVTYSTSYLNCDYKGSSTICVNLGTELTDMTSGVVCNGTDYKVTLRNTFDGKVMSNKTVHIKFSGKKIVNDYYLTTNAHGVAKFKFNASYAQLGKSFNVFAETYLGDGYDYVNCSSDIVIMSSCEFTNPSTDVYNGDYFNVTLNDANGNPISYTPVQIKVLRDTYDVYTDDNGVASIKLGNITNKEDKPVTVSYNFKGDLKYLDTNGSIDVNAHRFDTSFSNASSTVTNGSYFNVTLKDSNGNPLALKKVRFTLFYDEFYNVVTDANGVAHLRLNVTDKDMNDIMVQYYFDGDDNYKATNGYTIINVTDNK
ncbi:MAG: hypothetical protein MJ232_04950 [archaeon]|nr:hypothetical protein [archaeon]